MAYEKKEGDCVLFENNKRTNDKQPLFRGTIFRNGKEHELFFWQKTSKAGNTFFTGSVGAVVEAKPQSSGDWGSSSQKSGFQPAYKPPEKDVPDEDLPF